TVATWHMARVARGTVARGTSLDHNIDRGRRNAADTEILGRIHLDAKIVPAGSEPGKVHERIDRAGTQVRHGFFTASDGHARERWLELRAQARAQVPPPDRHTGKLPFD